MNCRALVATGILGLALSQTAAAIPMTEVVTFSGGTATFSFDSATPTGVSCVGPACGLDSFSATLAGTTWGLGDVSDYSVLFEPATQIASWSVSLFKKAPTPVGEATFGGNVVGLTGGTLGGQIVIVTQPRLVKCDPADPLPCDFADPPVNRSVVDITGTWTTPVRVPGTDTSVPEPTSAALALLGLGVALRRRRQSLA